MNKGINKEKLINALKHLEQDFNFDPKNTKNRLLSNIARRHLSLNEQNRFIYAPRGFSLKWAAGFAAVILFAGLGTTFAVADTATPADKLFAIDQLQEKIILALPLKNESKAKIKINIAKERALEMAIIKNLPDNEPAKARAVKASEQSLTKAYKAVNENRERLKNKGQSKAVEQLDSVLSELDSLAQEHEQRIHDIRAGVSDKAILKDIDERLFEIGKSRSKSKQQNIRGLDKIREERREQNKEQNND